MKQNSNLIKLFILLILSGCLNNKTLKFKETCKTKSYSIKNSHGTFVVCIQNHFIFDEIGLASFYTSGHTTALNTKFDTNYYTAAHPYLPLPCIAGVSLADNPEKKVIVKINDRGPFTKEKRIIDLSYRAAKELGIIKQGIAKVRVKILIVPTKNLKEHGGKWQWDGKKKIKITHKKKEIIIKN